MRFLKRIANCDNLFDLLAFISSKVVAWIILGMRAAFSIFPSKLPPTPGNAGIILPLPHIIFF